MVEETIWLDDPPSFEIDGTGVLFIGGEGKFHVRMSHASFRTLLERGRRALNAFEKARQNTVVDIKKPPE